MESTPELAEMMIAEHDAIESWEEFEEPPAGAAILVQQAHESFRNILRRAYLRARDLRVSGYRLNSMSYLLGPCDPDRFDNRVAVARGMLAILPDQDANLHLVVTQGLDQITPLTLIDRLHLMHPGPSIQVHFKRAHLLSSGAERLVEARPMVSKHRSRLSMSMVAKPPFNAHVRGMEVVS